jgi:Ca-activated chloride channel family protein
MMQYKFDPYIILGLSNQADSNDIKRAYRRLAQRLHPDSNPDNPGAWLQFQDVSDAYNLLMDAQEREKYDKHRESTQEVEDAYFTLRATPSKRAIAPLEEEQVIYLLAEIFAPPQAENTAIQKSNINLTLVLDESNSMKQGARIERVKIAAQRIIEQLGSKNILSVITFNDRATTIIPATPVTDKKSLIARVSMINPSGGTEIFKGLSAGYSEIKKHLSPQMVNHIVLLTDGHTYGDQEKCLELADEAQKKGVVINAMGMGHDWNDEFLDQLAAKTGGVSEYINSSELVIRFMNDHVRNMSNSFADRLQLCVAPDQDISLEMAFKLAPNPQPMELENGALPLASLQAKRPISVLLQFAMPPNMNAGFRTIARLVVTGSIMHANAKNFYAVSDLSVEITENPPRDEPPNAIMDALSKLTLYRLQEKAKDALDRGDIEEATKRLENLATRLLELGEDSLANQTLSEAQQIKSTKVLSEKGRKTIKYETRALLGQAGLKAALSSLLVDNSPDDAS